MNENGFETEEFIALKIVWASAANLSGREYYEAAAVQKENTVKFKIRAIPDIDESMKIKFKGMYYNITAIDNINYKNRYMEIKAMEVKGSG